MTRICPRRIWIWIGCLALLGSSTGCQNIWEWAADANSFDALMSDGREALRSEQYALAEEKFVAAVQLRPDHSEARYFLAKAAVLNADVDVYFLVQTLTNDTPGSSAVEIFSYEAARANSIYRANSVVIQNLVPIRQGLALQGDIAGQNVDLDLSIAYVLRAILRLRDTNGDGLIDESDLPVSEFQLGQSSSGFTLVGLENLNPQQINAMIQEASGLLFEGAGIVVNVSGDSGVNVAALQELYSELQSGMVAYYLNTGIPGNPGEGDNDGDGTIDEECFNGIDDDFDDRTDEDARIIGC